MRIKGLFQWVVCMGLLTAGLLLAGCAPDNTRLEFSYSPAPATMELEAGSPASVTVYEFGDDRQNQVYVGQAMADYSNPLGSAVHYQTARPVGQVVTNAIVRSLESQGFRVVRASGWNLIPPLCAISLPSSWWWKSESVLQRLPHISARSRPWSISA